MPKYFLLYMMLFWLPMVARGQTITDLVDINLNGLPQPTTVKALRYWFDDDDGSIRILSQPSKQQVIDVSGLIEGLHTLHYQVIDSRDDVAYISSCVFMKIRQSDSTAFSLLRYWFDDDASSTKTITSAGVQSLDVSALLDGLHTIHYQAVGSDGVASYVASGLFLKAVSSIGTETVKPSQLMYWFDDETTIQNVGISQGVQMLDASDLIDGLHTIHYQVLCNNGQMTPAMSSLFLRISTDEETAVAKSLRYWFDDSQMSVEVAIADGVQLLDASALIEGLHTIHYQIADSKGKLGAPYSSLFLKVDASASTVAQSLRYWFDDDAETVSTTSVAGGTQTLDVSALLAGLHTLHYQLIDNQGQVTAPVTRLFMKNFDKMIEGGQNRITKYKYWLNKNSQALQTVTLDAADNPYTLIALLPMQKEPIQTSQFHFELTDGQPTIFAKNTFHIRFHDATSYFKDGEKQFIDYRVKQVVEPVGELQMTQTFDKVPENDIRWYTMQVASGDTAAFRLSQPATVQVFAPSGKEVFKTSESASVNWVGIHTWENGTYYVAVHDVTGSQNTMALDYMHMDKYDVVDWDVHTVGNGGCSTTTFKGNGFRDLYAVDLYTAEGDSIHSVNVSHESDAETAVTFDFSGAELGVYDAVFHFTEEDKHVSEVVTVEEAVDIELATNVSFPSSFLRGTSTTYTIKITNKGNMTAYRVPIHIYMNTLRQENIEHIDILGLELQPIFSGICKDSLSTEDKVWLENLQEKIGDAHYFIGKNQYNEVLQDSQYVQSATFYSDISPLSQRVITVTIKASESIYVSISTPKDYFSLLNPQASANQNTKRFIKRNASPKESFCCYRERIECIANIVADVANIADALVGLAPGCPHKAATAAANCIAGTVKQVVKASGTVFCDDNSVERNFWDNVKSVLDGISLTETISKCASRFLPGGSFKEIMKVIAEGNKYTKAIDAFSIGVDGGDCIRAFWEKMPNCPPNPGGGGGTSTPYTPIDPNDIYGYLSDAGTKFMSDTVAQVNYTIEFENDTAFATAAAHTIVIRDTLDSRYFDLENFMPTAVRIGAKEELLAENEVYSSKGVTSFVKTIDMRPEINAIAQVEGEYSWRTGIAEWRFTSLDPMTMEATEDLMQGILPVNYNGTSGIGEVMFEVGVKPNKGDGTEVMNRAGIVFDYEEAILTPTWTNIVDAVAPTSTIMGCRQTTDSTLVLRLTGEDNRSGVWKYAVYEQAGRSAPWYLVKENITDSLCEVRIYEGIDYGYMVLATDSAGNVERKEWLADFRLSTALQGDVNGDGNVDLTDAIMIVYYSLGQKPVGFDKTMADMNGDGAIDLTDAIIVVYKSLGYSIDGQRAIKKRLQIDQSMEENQ